MAAVLLVAAGLALLIGACGGGDDEPEPTPIEPTPTAMMPAVDTFRPITAILEEDPLAFFASIPPFERNCLVQVVGTVRFDEIAQGSPIASAEGDLLLGCITGVTAGRFVAGSLINETTLESLSTETLDCMEVEFADLTPSDFVDSIEGLSTDELLVDLSGVSGASLDALLGALFCLNDEERAAVDARLAGEVGDELALTIDQVECLDRELGGEGFSGFIGGGEALPLNLLGTLAVCGVDLSGISGAMPVPAPGGGGTGEEAFGSLTPEQMICLQEAGVVSRLERGDIGLDMLNDLTGCGVDLSELEALAGVGGGG